MAFTCLCMWSQKPPETVSEIMNLKFFFSWGSTPRPPNLCSHCCTTVVQENFSIEKFWDTQWYPKSKYSKYVLHRIIKATKYLQSEKIAQTLAHTAHDRNPESVTTYSYNYLIGVRYDLL